MSSLQTMETEAVTTRQHFGILEIVQANGTFQLFHCTLCHLALLCHVLLTFCVALVNHHQCSTMGGESKVIIGIDNVNSGCATLTVLL